MNQRNIGRLEGYAAACVELLGPDRKKVLFRDGMMSRHFSHCLRNLGISEEVHKEHDMHAHYIHDPQLLISRLRGAKLRERSDREQHLDEKVAEMSVHTLFRIERMLNQGYPYEEILKETEEVHNIKKWLAGMKSIS